MEEPTCPNHWCNTLKSKKWAGPGKEGWVIDPDGTRRVLHLNLIKCDDNNERCEEWASNDECEKNPRYMLRECEKSCKVCETLFAGSHDEL
jgi:hypothetical protein